MLKRFRRSWVAWSPRVDHRRRRGDGGFIIDNYRTVAEIIDRQPNTVTHGDAHPGNVYFRNGDAGLLDWQAVRRGHPGRELAYTLITGMTTAERQDRERDLLATYPHVLAAAGGPAPLITAGMGRMQDESIALEGVRRGVTALTDLETVAALRQTLAS